VALVGGFRVRPVWLEQKGTALDPKKLSPAPNWTKAGSPYLRICRNAMDKQVMATNATETTVRLNLRIRFAYNCDQLGFAQLLMYAFPHKPILGFHVPLLLDRKRRNLQRQNYPERKTNLSPIMKTLENPDDLSGTTKCSCVMRTCPPKRLCWSLKCVHFMCSSVCCSA
jgi:hypothetical protein